MHDTTGRYLKESKKRAMRLNQYPNAVEDARSEDFGKALKSRKRKRDDDDDGEQRKPHGITQERLLGQRGASVFDQNDVNASEMHTKAVQQFFGRFELLEQALNYLSPPDVLVLQRVSHTWLDIVEGFLILRRKLWRD